MTPRPNAVRIGLFAIGGLGLLVAALLVIFGGRLFAPSERAVMHFSGSVQGLQVGAPVVFRGVRMGSVRSIGVVRDQGQYRIPVVAEIAPATITDLDGRLTAGETELTLQGLVAQGLTARLVTRSLLTGQLYVDLDLRPAARAAAAAAASAQPAASAAAAVAAATRQGGSMIEIPTAPQRLQALQEQVEALDVGRIGSDLAGTLAAARALLSGAEIKQTLSESAQAAAALARLSTTLERRVPPLAAGAQATLSRAGDAASRAGDAAVQAGQTAERVSAAADRIGAAAGRADALLAPGSPVLASVQAAADELGRSAAALRVVTTDDSASVQTLQRAMADVSRSARAVRDLAELLERQPDALLRGKRAAP